MRSELLLIAAASCAKAGWFKWTENQGQVWRPEETGYVDYGEQLTGWTPKPTQAPGKQTEEQRILRVLRRQTDDNTWLNSKTCGYFSGPDSAALACTNSSTCATNSNHVVACKAGTESPFFSVCLDQQAVTRGFCSGIGPGTGCCGQSDNPACGTYIWTGTPQRVMYRCFKSQTVISMLDVPQTVLDASLSSKGMTVSSGSGRLTGTNGGGSQGLGGASSTGNAGDNNNNNSNNNNSIGAIVGGVIGGVAGIALLSGIAIFFILRGKKAKKQSGGGKQAYSAVSPHDPHQQGPSPGMAYSGAAGASSTYGSTPYSSSATPSTDPNAPAHGAPYYAGHQQQQNMYAHQPGAAGQGGWGQTAAPYGAPGTQNQHQMPATELDGIGYAPSGHQANPIEMASSPQRP